MEMAASPYEAVDANGRRARSESEMETTASSYEAMDASERRARHESDTGGGDAPPAGSGAKHAGAEDITFRETFNIIYKSHNSGYTTYHPWWCNTHLHTATHGTPVSVARSHEHAKDGRQLRALDCRNYPLWSSYPRSAYKLTESEFVGTAEVAGKCG